MLHLPESFVQSASRNMADGAVWLGTLPGIFNTCIARWNLTDWSICEGLGSNLVCTAHSGEYGPVVLKVEGPHETRHTEPAALRTYAGRHACKLLDVDNTSHALLLERILPGATLKSIADKDAQLEIGSELVRLLPVSSPDASVFTSYADWIKRAFGLVRRSADPAPLMLDFMARAEDDFKHIAAVDTSRVLLHGDLHHENIVSGAGNTWKAIDPQGVIGPACLECGRFIQNHVGDDERHELDTNLLAQAVEHFAKTLGQAPLTIARCVFVLDVLSTSWGYEMHYPPERINARLNYSQAIQDYTSTL